MEREELAGWLRLALAPGIGNSAARKLLGAFGLPEAIFRQGRAALEQVVTPAQAEALRSEPAELPGLVEATWQWLTAADARQPRHALTLADARYPAALLQIADPPLILYVTGPLAQPWPAGLAMVGSRNPTPQGIGNARQFAAAFARSGWTVVSGLALGIDAAAHEGALEGAAAGTLATIAVVGTGLDRVYPKQNLALAHRVAQQGLVVSEYPIGTPPLAANFPRRNRIIAALSQGTVVVEAALQSGSLITARQAVEQGKEVFAIPGSIHSPQSRGCHALLKQGAKLVETAQDVLEELPALGVPRVAEERAAPAVHGEPDPLLQALGFDPVSLDALVARTGTPAPALQAKLLELELRGEVARLPGGLFQRIALA
ncbi:DNA-processing protein DprA [Ramlibacter solisilvae]|uniref:DNA processing protein DprA n=1 Tax=Ramlibacter tataouinensis TaxID=94132 RepID=A0A127JT37_9BURK|nr:DNA-processing protein DprA [Ramlibacter tataouinensis]AMO23095.1 DNA processing protein DprA [Ramlibacter tataouinensis]